MNTSWYVVRSKPQKEGFLCSQLSLRGVDVFFPFLCVKPVNPRSRTVRPYFPGYLFARINGMAECFSAFNWIPGSLGVVSFGGEPADVPAELIRSLQRCLEHVNTGFCKEAVFSPGDPVVVRDGVFDGYQAIFDTHMPGNDRVRVLLQYLKGRQVALVLPVRQIELAQGA